MRTQRPRLLGTPRLERVDGRSAQVLIFSRSRNSSLAVW